MDAIAAIDRSIAIVRSFDFDFYLGSDRCELRRTDQR